MPVFKFTSDMQWTWLQTRLLKMQTSGFSEPLRVNDSLGSGSHIRQETAERQLLSGSRQQQSFSWTRCAAPFAWAASSSEWHWQGSCGSWQKVFIMLLFLYVSPYSFFHLLEPDTSSVRVGASDELLSHSSYVILWCT